MKNMESKYYICTGANYRNGYDLAHVGEIHSMSEWLRILFPQKNAEDYFKDYSPKSILEYLHKCCGKRLEKVK